MTAAFTAASFGQVSLPGGNGPGNNPWISSSNAQIADETPQAPDIVRADPATRNIRLVVVSPDGIPLSGAAVAAMDIDGVMQKSVALPKAGEHFLAGIGPKTTIEVSHPAFGTTTAEVIMPDARWVNLEIQMGTPTALARVLYQNSPLGLLSATGPFAVDGAIAGGGGSDCCIANGTPGCDDPDCEALVCGIDPFCCDTAWDGICAGEAMDLCGDLCPPPPPCVIDCPPGALEEGEACGTDTNGGCNSTPPIYTDAACGETWCGNAWAEGGTRDTDWYLVDLADTGGNGTEELRATLTSQFDGVCFIVDGIAACAPIVVGTTGASNDCVQLGDAFACLPAPGTYVVFVATAAFDGTPCGSGDNDYVVSISCQDCEPPPGPCDDPNAGDCCQDGGNGTPGCNDPSCCNLVCSIDPFCCDVSWDGICAGEAQDLCEVCAQPGACCFADGSCQDVGSQAECTGLGGTYQGAGSSCANVVCPVVCGPDSGDCCQSGGNGTPGCNDPDCCNAVCAIDPFCCDVSWDGICADEAGDICADCMGPPPPNDNCEDAIPVAVPSNTDGTTNDATLDPNAPFCDTSVTVGGVWYSVVGTGNTMTASFCEVFASDCCFSNGSPGCDDADCEAAVCAIDGFCCDVSWDGICAGEAADLCGDLCANAGGGSASYDSKLSVYCGECDALTCVVGNDDFCGLSSQVSWCSQPGATYLIFVHGFSTAQGDFDLFVTDDGVSCSGGVQCLAEGACCLPGGDCQDLTEAACGDAGGAYQGDGTSCTGQTFYVTTECANAFVDISSTGILAPIASSSDDGGDANIPLGFSFNFYGDSHTTVGIASNGYLQFGTDLGDFTNDPIPTAAIPNNAIFPLWDDWSPNQAGDVYYESSGNTFTAQWTNVPHFNTGAISTFQAVLHGDTNCVEYRYGSPLSYVDPTVGVENQDGTDGEPIGFGPVVASGDCVQICPESEGGVDCVVLRTLLCKGEHCPCLVNVDGNKTTFYLAGEADFDVSTVDLNSLELRRCDGVGGAITPWVTPVIDDTSPASDDPASCAGGCNCIDENADGNDDLVMEFKNADLASTLQLGSEPNGATVSLVLTGQTTGGESFEAVDCVEVFIP